MNEDRVVASFLGGAVGDAFGLTTEFLGRGQIEVYYRSFLTADDALGLRGFANFDPAAFFPEGHGHLIRITKATYALEGIERDLIGQHGVYTDDTTQLLAVMESLNATGAVADRLGIAEQLRRWMVEVGVGMGQSFYNAVSHEDFLTNPHGAAFDYLESLNFFPAANGAVMRAAPLGALSLASPEGFHFEVADIAAVTHANPRCILSAVFAASVMAGVLQGLSGRDGTDFAMERAADIYAHAYDADAPWTAGIVEYRDRLAGRHWDAAFEELRGLVNGLWDDASLTSLAQIRPDCGMDMEASAPIGYTYLPIRLLVAAIKLELSYDAAIRHIVSLGGDADTNACVVGAVLAAQEPENERLWQWAERLLPVQKARAIEVAERFVANIETRRAPV